jgi:hypothetical protein
VGAGGAALGPVAHLARRHGRQRGGLCHPLGAGDGPLFAAICLASGLALGADLALPGALLTGVIHQAGAGQQGEGRYLGWWACATKLNLALAAGLALPLLAAAGYQPGAPGVPAAHDANGLQALAWAYGGLPCCSSWRPWPCCGGPSSATPPGETPHESPLPRAPAPRCWPWRPAPGWPA